MKQPVRLLEATAHILLAFLIVQAATAAPSGVSAPVPPPLALYGELPSLADPALSPAGDRLAFLESQNGRRYIVIFDLAKGKPIALAHADSAKVRSLRWYDDNQLLIIFDDLLSAVRSDRRAHRVVHARDLGHRDQSDASDRHA